MSSGLAPSKSTVYVSNVPFSLTNNDLHKIFEKCGKVVKVTIVKDKKWRTSKGVAFILYLKREDAQRCVEEFNHKELFGRTLKCSIAKDNGRAAEFIKKKEYPDKSVCYECREEGHLSYACPVNALGERQPPPKKSKKDKKQGIIDKETLLEYLDADDMDYKDDLETLSTAIKIEQLKQETEDYRYRVAVGDYNVQPSLIPRKKIKKDAYFSDEEEISD